MYKVVIIEDRAERYRKLKTKIEEYPNLLTLVESARIIQDFQNFEAYVKAISNSQGDIYLVDWELELNGEFYTPSDLIYSLSEGKRVFTVHNKFWIFYSNSDKLAKNVPDYVQEYFGLDSPNTDRPGFLNLTENGRYLKYNYFDHSIKKAINYLETFEIPAWTRDLPDSTDDTKVTLNNIDGKLYNLDNHISDAIVRHLQLVKSRLIALVINGKNGVLVFIDQEHKIQFFFIRMNNDFKKIKNQIHLEKLKPGVFLNRVFFESTFLKIGLKSKYQSYVHRRSEILNYLRTFNQKSAGSNSFSVGEKDIDEINNVFDKLYKISLTPRRFVF